MGEGTDSGLWTVVTVLSLAKAWATGYPELFYAVELVDGCITERLCIWVWKSEAIVYSLILLVTLGVLFFGLYSENRLEGWRLDTSGDTWARLEVTVGVTRFVNSLWLEIQTVRLRAYWHDDHLQHFLPLGSSRDVPDRCTSVPTWAK